MAAAGAALEGLQADAADARRALQRAEIDAAVVAGAVLVHESERLGKELAAAFTDLWARYDDLWALTGFWLPDASGQRRPPMLPAEAVKLLQTVANFDHRQYGGGRNPALARCRARWQCWFEASLLDSDAALVEDEPAREVA